MDYWYSSWEDSIVSKLQSSKFTGGIYCRVIDSLYPFIPFINPFFVPPGDPSTIPYLSKNYSSVLYRSLLVLPNILMETPNMSKDCAMEFLDVYRLCIDCLDIIAPELGDLRASLDHRYYYICCLRHWKKYDEAKSECKIVLDKFNMSMFETFGYEQEDDKGNNFLDITMDGADDEVFDVNSINSAGVVVKDGLQNLSSREIANCGSGTILEPLHVQKCISVEDESTDASSVGNDNSLPSDASVKLALESDDTSRSTGESKADKSGGNKNGREEMNDKTKITDPEMGDENVPIDSRSSLTMKVSNNIQDCMAFGSEAKDIMSMNMTAVISLLQQYGFDPKQIGHLEVGSETKSKSIQTFFLPIFEEFGNTDIKGVDSTNACYGGTTAFAVSGYSPTDGRNCKLFNQLLGKTYEAEYPDKGLRFISEKMSHPPILVACHGEGASWRFTGDINLKRKFWERSIQLDLVGVLTMEFDDGEVFQWKKVMSSIYNLILWKLYCDRYGIMWIQENHNYSCQLKFKELVSIEKQLVLDRAASIASFHLKRFKNEALRLPISDAVPIYEQLLATFPTSAKYWKQFVEAYMAVNNDEATRQVFSRCLLNCLLVPLWSCYIRFIRRVNDKKGTEGQEETKRAYDFMLNHVGADIASGPVWMEYITFLKSLPAQTTVLVEACVAVQPILTVGGIGGVATAFAAKDILGNVFSELSIQMSQLFPIRIWDPGGCNIDRGFGHIPLASSTHIFLSLEDKA